MLYIHLITTVPLLVQSLQWVYVRVCNHSYLASSLEADHFLNLQSLPTLALIEKIWYRVNVLLQYMECTKHTPLWGNASLIELFKLGPFEQWTFLGTIHVFSNDTLKMSTNTGGVSYPSGILLSTLTKEGLVMTP